MAGQCSLNHEPNYFDMEGKAKIQNFNIFDAVCLVFILHDSGLFRFVIVKSFIRLLSSL